jgi:hypothetical protein
MDSTDVAQDRHKWHAFVKMVMKIQVPYNTGNYWLAGEMLASQERLCSKASVSYLVSQLVNQSETFSYLVSQSLMHSLCQTVRQPASQPASQSVSDLVNWLFIDMFYLFIYLHSELVAFTFTFICY